MAEPTKGPRRETAWEVADRNIRRYQRSIERALLGGKANISICREMIDRWLEYRQRHAPDDERAEL
ncbi:MAG TPA: hypothetical protein VGN13_05550 [Solirubrobacteraceae bacterium]|jgi:hypothetical protein